MAWGYSRIHSVSWLPIVEGLLVTTPEEYRALLITALTVSGIKEYDPAEEFSIAELEQTVMDAGLPLPLVRLPEHYLRGSKWFTNRGMVPLCNCSAEWPCPEAVVIPPIELQPDVAAPE